MRLSGRIACVTGASAGFGMETARHLAREGAKVILTGRRHERLAALAKELGNSAYPLTFDIRSQAAVTKAFTSLPETFRNVDILVNNAGLALGTASLEAQEMTDLEQMMDTNIKGLVYATHSLLPGMVSRGCGHIINISSIAGTYPYPGGNVYGATKAFVTQFSLNLRADLVAKNVRVTNIEPGLAETEFSLVRFHGDAQKAKAVYEGTTPLSAKDIAEAVVWCAVQPAHVNVNRIELMATCQAFSPFAIHRQS